MAAEQKARTTYDNILRMSDDPDVNDVIGSSVNAKSSTSRDLAKLKLATERMDQRISIQ